MSDRSYPVLRTIGRALFVLATTLALATAARADVIGRLHFVVTDADTGKPLPKAVVTLHDPTNVRGDIPLNLDANGAVTSGELSVHAWQATTTLDGYDSDKRTVAVTADTTTEVDIDLAKTEKVVNITSGRNLINSSQTANGSQRTSGFVKTYSLGNGNPQDLKSLIGTTPGFVSSSVGVAHPRGEHNQVTIMIDGALLPDALQGRAGQILSPQVIQNADIMTGAYAPEYGSESAAILNLELKAGPLTPFVHYDLSEGSYDTSYGELSAGGQFGPTLESGVEGPAPRRFRYLFDISDRYTAAALESPQPDDQTAHNAGTSMSIFGNLDYQAGLNDDISLVLNSTPAHTEIANRTGLPSEYAPIGQGYGYGGERDADGSLAGIPASSGLLGSATEVLPSQQAAGQDVYQDDDNDFSLLNYRHTFSDELTGLLSAGFNHSNLDIKNNNPSITDAYNPDGTLTQTDNSIEFNPTVLQHSTEEETGGSLTLSKPKHTYKVGFQYQNQVGDDSYQFIPQSQLALDALGSVQVGGPQLTPNGYIETNAQGDPVLDALGNPIYIETPGAGTPTVVVHKQGYYGAAYAQDTWKATSRLTINYGARLDSYFDRESDGLPTPSVHSTELSPRLNTAYAITSSTIGRLSYNKLFTQPPLTQGAIVGSPLVPETLDLYEGSVEHQLSSTQKIKVDAYYKNIHDQIDTGILIPFTQVGAYTTLQYDHASVHGIELSYELDPKNNVGVGSFVSLTNSLAKPGGNNQLGLPAPIINDHDQLWTISSGLSYTFKSGAFVAADNYFGSGEASSILAPITPFNSNVLNGGTRNNNDTLNLRLATPPHVFGKSGTLELDVDNVFDSLSVLNFDSGFSGTRFQFGRTVSLKFVGRSLVPPVSTPWRYSPRGGRTLSLQD